MEGKNKSFTRSRAGEDSRKSPRENKKIKRGKRGGESLKGNRTRGGILETVAAKKKAHIMKRTSEGGKKVPSRPELQDIGYEERHPPEESGKEQLLKEKLNRCTFLQVLQGTGVP